MIAMWRKDSPVKIVVDSSFEMVDAQKRIAGKRGDNSNTTHFVRLPSSFERFFVLSGIFN